jgi:hypothetical protein
MLERGVDWCFHQRKLAAAEELLTNSLALEMGEDDNINM